MTWTPQKGKPSRHRDCKTPYADISKRTIPLGAVVVGLGRMFDTSSNPPHSKCQSRYLTVSRTAEVIVEIDPGKLMRYAERAAASKTGKATGLHGALVFKVRAKWDEPIPLPRCVLNPPKGHPIEPAE